MQNIMEEVRSYYGKILSKKEDLKTSASCSANSMPEYQLQLLRNIMPENQC